MHRVTFIGDYFSLTTYVFAYDEEQAERMAQELMLEQYGWQPEMYSNDIEVEREENPYDLDNE